MLERSSRTRLSIAKRTAAYSTRIRLPFTTALTSGVSTGNWATSHAAAPPTRRVSGERNKLQFVRQDAQRLISKKQDDAAVTDGGGDGGAHKADAGQQNHVERDVKDAGIKRGDSDLGCALVDHQAGAEVNGHGREHQSDHQEWQQGVRFLKFSGSKQHDHVARSYDGDTNNRDGDENELVQAAGKKVLRGFFAFSIPDAHADGKQSHLQRLHQYVLQIDGDAVSSGIKAERLRAQIMLDEETVTGIEHDPGYLRCH